MEIDFGHWLEIYKNNPVLLVLTGGMVGGSAVTQAVKATYLAWITKASAVSVTRYRNTCMWLAILLTFYLTNRFWMLYIGDNGTGLRHMACSISAFASPFVYKGVKALISVKWPNFAAKWGDNGHKLQP